MKSIKLSLMVLLAGIMAFGLASAKDSNVEKLQNKLKNLNSLEAGFSQISIDAKGMRLQESSGVAKFMRPNKMHWFVQRPYEQLLVTNGNKVWFYEKDLEQVSIEKLNKNSSATPMLVLFEDTKQIEKSFKLEYKQLNEVENFVLIPKAKDSLYDSFTFTFIKNRFSKISLADSMNQKTIIRFIKPKFNHKIKSSEFEFNIPKNVDVIDKTN